jgi:hypothetical protein
MATEKELKESFEGRMTGEHFVSPICNLCIHREAGAVTCKAYPDGIPQDILSGHSDHTTVLEGQTGEFVFEQGTKK